MIEREGEEKQKELVLILVEVTRVEMSIRESLWE